MRLDHLLSKEMETGEAGSKGCVTVDLPRRISNTEGICNGFAKQILFSGGDALMGHTRSHPEHDG